MEEIFYFDENYINRAKWCNENDCHIEEVEGDENGRRFKIVKNEEDDLEEILRVRREVECFPVVNRGTLWYENLTAEQYLELKDWYQLWLDVTKIKTAPQKPDWIK